MVRFPIRGLLVPLLMLLTALGMSVVPAAWAQSLAAVPQAEVVAREADAPPERWVFLVHGLLMTRGSMNYLEERLTDAGFTVVNHGYDSRQLTLQQAGDFLHSGIESYRENSPNMEVNLVTHSMGGLVARSYVTQYAPEGFGALVQIAPPNQGSEKADLFADYFFYRLLYGQNGVALKTDRADVQKAIGYPNCPIGIIAGGTGDSTGFSELIDGDDDGTISVRRTMLARMTDHIVLRHIHAFIMRKREVADQVIYFLNRGRFRRDQGVLYPPVPGTIAAVE